MKDIVLIFFSTALNLAGQLLMKKGMTSAGIVDGIMSTVRVAVLSPTVLGGVLLQTGSLALWLFILSRANLNFALATASGFFYTLMPLATWYFGGEKLSPVQLAGMLLICAGVYCLSPRV